MSLRVNRLQLLQGGLAAPETLWQGPKSVSGPDRPLPWPPCPSQGLPAHLTLAAQAPLLQPRPNALDAARVFGVSAVVSAGALMLQHY